MATGAAASIIGVLESSFDAGVGCAFTTMVKPSQLVWTDMDARMQDGPWAHIDGRPQKLEVLGKLEWPDKKGRVPLTAGLRPGSYEIVVDGLK
jgi:hypothetical protein